MTYLERVSPTYIENWPAELCRLSIAQAGVKLTRNTAISLGCRIIELGEGFDDLRVAAGLFPVDVTARVAWLRAAIDEEVGKFPHGAFVRLGSRSPKDALYPVKQPANTGAHAIQNLTACSERVYEDLLLAIHEDYAPHVWLRQWIDIPEWSEFRCFMKERKLVGISQYYYRETYPEIVNHADSIKWAIEHWFPGFRGASHLDDVVFDVFVRVHARGNEVSTEVKLLEINPFFEMTDPCLFDWRHPEEFDGSFRLLRGAR